MNDSDILKQLKQPKLLLDIAAGSLSILGVFVSQRLGRQFKEASRLATAVDQT